METNFVKADSGNLPKIDAIMVGLFFKNNPDFYAAELKNVKTALLDVVNQSAYAKVICLKKKCISKVLTTQMSDVSVIIPIFNGELWINECFSAIQAQTAQNKLKIEICVCNDASTDNSSRLLRKWMKIFEGNGISLKVVENRSDVPKGVGYSKNKAVDISTGCYLCFQDVDDVMLPDRILKQYERAIQCSDNTLIGCRFERNPVNSTVRYTKWANNLTENQLRQQIYTSNGPTVIMPTWFCHRNVFNRTGGFDESGKGTPEDLIFFYRHLDNGGFVARVDEVLLIYRYHLNSATFSVHEETIWNIRIKRLEEKVLKNWTNFTIWNAGKQGRKFYSTLQPVNQHKVIAFCDVDTKKIGKPYQPYNSSTRKAGRKIDVIHFSFSQPPYIICVKQDMTSGVFEENLKSLNIEEGKDFIYFS